MNNKTKILLALTLLLVTTASHWKHEHQIPPCVCMPGAPSGWWDSRCWSYGWERIQEREIEGIPSYEKVCK